MDGKFFVCVCGGGHGTEQRQETMKREFYFKQSHDLMIGDSNPKRDISEIILPLPVTVLLDEVWL